MAKRLPNLNDHLNLERFNGGDCCPGRELACWASNQSGGVWLKDLTTGAEELIPCRGAGSPQFSPDGSALFYLAAAESGGRQLFCMELDSRESRQITRFAGPILEPICSPDGRRVLFASVKSLGLNAPKGRADEAVVIEDFGYKFDGRGFIRPDEHMHLYVADVGSGEVTALTSGEEDFMQANWLPDSRTVVCISACKREKSESLGFDLFLLNVDKPDSEPVQISRDLNLVSYPNPTRPVVSPDGKYVYMGVMEMDSRIGNTYPEIYFYRFPTDGGEAARIFTPDEGCYQCVQFPYNAFSGVGLDKVRLSEDGKTLYFLSGWQGQCNLYALDVDGDGHARLLSGGKWVCHGLGPVRGGKMLVTHAETDKPESYWLLDAQTGTLEREIARSARKLLDEVSLSRAEDFFFPTLDGESAVHGWVLPPQQMEPGKKYPAILYIHGGPHPFYTYGCTMEHQCLAAEGFVVLYCNPRGSSGYGMKHQNIARSTDGSAYVDLHQFVEEAVRRYDFIDPERVGVTGGSYGGYMTNYIASHSSRFKAYVTQRSVSNELIMYASSDLQGSSEMFTNFEEFMVDRLRDSVVCHAEQIDCPFLILHGMEDHRTPVYGAHQLYVALKDLHPELPVKMVLFPHVAHDQPSDPRQLQVYFDELVGWFRQYL